jgi:HicA toxin of bacterial toxin-antitoxin,
MRAKHAKTLQAIFTKPTATSLEWVRIEALFIALGCRVIEGRGSRVRFEFNGKIIAFHRPHPAKEAKPYQVELARDFLIAIGANHEYTDL